MDFFEKAQGIIMANILIFFFSFLAEAIMLWQYASNLYTCRYSFQKRFTEISILYIVLFLCSLMESTWLNAALFLLANFLFFVTQYHIKWYFALFHVSVITGIMSMCELVVYGIITSYAADFFTGPLYLQNMILHAIFSKILLFTIIHILIHIQKMLPKSEQPAGKVFLILGIIPITSLFIMLTFVSIDSVLSYSFGREWMISVSAVLLLAINLLVFGMYQYNQRKSMEYFEMQMTLQKESNAVEYYKMLLSQNENQNILIHDIKNHLNSILLLNEKREYGAIDTYINQIFLSSSLKESSRLCDNEILNAILFRYKEQCNEHGIAFYTDIRSESMNFISNMDMTSLFCNLLDNAVEAANGVSEAFIEINIMKKDESALVVISIINTCQKDPFSKEGRQLVTKKNDKARHGFGMKSIKKIVQKYQGNLEMYYSDIDQTFHTIIILK